MKTYSLSAVRAVALHTQGLANQTEPSLESIARVVNQIGCLQIDTLQVVQRSQYLVLWSRFGSYDTTILDYLMFDPQRRMFFEYWLHAACIIPLTRYRYLSAKMRWLRKPENHWREEWLSDPENMELVDKILEHVRENGPVRSSEFDAPDGHRSAWWGWKPAKRALEYLFDCGELMIADRVNFQRLYDIKERVLPKWVNTIEPDPDETNRFFLESAAKSLGVCELKQIPDYIHMKRTPAAPYLKTLVKEGWLVEIRTRLADGKTQKLVIHHDQLPLLEQAADGALEPQHTTFLSPFDSLFWARNRDQQFWNFRQVLEAYKPEPQREWGYFCLPILHRDRLVGRFDPKLERKTGVLRLKALYLEDGISPDEDLVEDVAGAMRDFMRFHDAQNLVIEYSNPEEFGRRLERAL